jgi:predicted XRE-type DNA-binding protein
MGDERVIVSSGNVYKDFRYPDAEEMQATSKLARQVLAIIQERELTQRQAAAILGIDQPKVSLLSRGRLRGFSIGKLFEFLNRLDRDVDVLVRPKRPDQPQGRTIVVSHEAKTA